MRIVVLDSAGYKYKGNERGTIGTLHCFSNAKCILSRTVSHARMNNRSRSIAIMRCTNRGHVFLLKIHTEQLFALFSILDYPSRRLDYLMGYNVL